MPLASVAAALAAALLSAAPAEVPVTGDVFIVTKGGQNVKLGLVEVRVIPERQVSAALPARLAKHRGELDRLRQALATASADESILRMETTTAEFELKTARLNTRGHGARKTKDPEKLEVAERAQAAFDAKQLECFKKEAERISIEREIASVNAGALMVRDWPAPLIPTKTDADGKFTTKLKPGKYAVVAASKRMIGDTTEEYYWLVWATFVRGHDNRIMLSNDNLFETGCPACVVRVEDLAKRTAPAEPSPAAPDLSRIPVSESL